VPTPTVDAQTLLLDTFAGWDGGARTAPEKGKGYGTVQGVCERLPGDSGPLMRFSSRRVETPEKGVNVYYTVRELSNYVAEMWPLRSLGDEIFSTGEHFIYSVEKAEMSQAGGGYPWLKEHLVSGYVPAWRQPLFDGETDAAIATQGLSRWHNYYVEGMRWLMEKTGVDGLYLDGIGYDREIMKRIAKVMQRTDRDSRINFHSGNNYAYLDHRTSPANQYMEHFPYISNLWFGEMYDYNLPPDYWLIEVSGLPFGLTSEMLNYENGGNPYRGMLYGMTGRQHASVSAMWRFWDSFGIEDAEMIGYWEDACPVRTDRKGVLATVYRKPGKSLISLARWPEERTVRQAVVGPATTAPTIDGTLSSGEWDETAKLAGFSLLGDDKLAGEQSEVYVTHDAERLYVGFRCQQAAGPKADVKQRDGQTWTDDAVELFIQPDPQAGRYVQLVGNSTGVFADCRGQDVSWNGDWTYRASVHGGYWEGEVAVSFETLGMSAPTEGLQIGFNACRDRQLPTSELSTWAALGSGFHDPGHFGRLVFSERLPVTQDTPDRLSAEQRPVDVRLEIDWKTLGLDPAKAKLTAPQIASFQDPREFAVGEPIPVEPGKGWLVVVE